MVRAKRRWLKVAAAMMVMVGIAVVTVDAGAGSTEPRWVRHVRNYPGGISNGVRASLSPEVVAAQATPRSAPSGEATAAASGNVQMNDDSEPPLPQNETSVAASLAEPLVAVAAANDYVSGGVVIMRTADGGQSWRSTRLVPVYRPTSDTCNGGDPAVAYSSRDHAFYLAQLCFFRELAHSEVQVYKSEDNGRTWTPGRRSAVAASNHDYVTGTDDPSVFHDKEYIAVDNTPTSPHYGRLYVTWTKFHIVPDGRSDYCPIQLAYTDTVPTSNPSLTTFTHVAVSPDAPGSNGVGPSANQFSVPVIQNDGTVDILYGLEECNTSLDHGFRMQKSTTGGNTFLSKPIFIDKPGQWQDNPDLSDLLPNKNFRAPNTPSMAYSPTTGKLVVVYANYLNQASSGADISYQTSTDGGLTWSDTNPLSVRANGSPAPQDQFFPWIASDPGGGFYAIWLDCRLDPSNHMINTFEAQSLTDFTTFGNQRISTRSWDPDGGFFTSGAFIGDYSGIAASSAAVYPVWTDGRNTAIGRTGIGETDIFTNVEIH